MTGIRKLAVASLAAVAILPLAIGGIIWAINFHQMKKERAEFLPRYQLAMEGAIRRHYFTFEVLPAHAVDVLYVSPELRYAWVTDGVIACGLNRPSLTQGCIDLENEVFELKLAESRGKVADWKVELDIARKPLRDRNGDVAAQLDLFVDPGFDTIVGNMFLDDLVKQRGVSEDAMASFVRAYINVRQARLKTEQMLEMAIQLREMGVEVEMQEDSVLAQESDAQILAAMEAFLEAKASVMADLRVASITD